MHELRVELAAVAAGCRRYSQHLERSLAVMHAVYYKELWGVRGREGTSVEVGKMHSMRVISPLCVWLDVSMSGILFNRGACMAAQMRYRGKKIQQTESPAQHAPSCSAGPP